MDSEPLKDVNRACELRDWIAQELKEKPECATVHREKRAVVSDLLSKLQERIDRCAVRAATNTASTDATSHSEATRQQEDSAPPPAPATVSAPAAVITEKNTAPTTPAERAALSKRREALAAKGASGKAEKSNQASLPDEEEPKLKRKKADKPAGKEPKSRKTSSNRSEEK